VLELAPWSSTTSGGTDESFHGMTSLRVGVTRAGRVLCRSGVTLMIGVNGIRVDSNVEAEASSATDLELAAIAARDRLLLLAIRLRRERSARLVEDDICRTNVLIYQ
jgi:hypothetical protein